MAIEALVPVPTGASVLAYVGWPADDENAEAAETHARHAELLVRAYTRGKGFSGPVTSQAGWECAPDIARVIVSAAARSLNNPTANRRVEAGSFNSVPGSLEILSLLETLVLDGYRRKAG